MNFSDYTAYFHDGNVINISHIDNDLDLFLESSEVSLNSLEKGITLSEEHTLKGILHVKSVKKISVGGRAIKTKLTMKYPEGEILDLKIQGNQMVLLVEWSDPSINPYENDVSKIEVEAEEFYWENVLV